MVANPSSMSIFVYEHLTSGALAGEALSPSMLQEGNAMVRAISHDLATLGYPVVMMRDSRIPALQDPSGRISTLPIDSLEIWQQTWQQSLRQFQQFLVIAPETGGILAQLVGDLEHKLKRHLGSSAKAIALCSDKLRCSQYLLEHGIPSPQTFKASVWLNTAEHPASGDWVIKPLDGAGCEQTFKMPARQAQAYLASLPSNELDRMIIQPYLEGTPLSLNLFIDDTQLDILSVNRQHITESDHQLHLSHCEAGREDLIDYPAMLKLTEKIRATMPGLWGFVGIDLVQSADKLWLIEINPRLTASYAEPAFRQNRNPALRLQQNLKGCAH